MLKRGLRLLRHWTVLLIATLASVAWFSVVVSSPEITAQIEKSPQYNNEAGIFENTLPIPAVVERQTSLSVMFQFFFADNNRRPNSTLPEAPPSAAILNSRNRQLRFAWLGHSTLLLDIEGKRILIDPIFSNQASPVPLVITRFQPPAISLQAITNIDLVLISHDHYDHLDKPTIEQLAKRDIPFFAPLGVGRHLLAWGVKQDNIHELDWWDAIRFNGLQLTATPAQHFSGRLLLDNNKTLWTSWSISGETQRVFYSGDSGYSPHYKEIGEKLGPFKLTFLENGAYDDDWPYIHQTPEQAVQAHIDLRGEVMVPVHWGMFDLGMHSWYEPIERVSAAAIERQVTLVTPRLGELIEPDTIPPPRSQPWQQWWVPLLPAYPATAIALAGKSKNDN